MRVYPQADRGATDDAPGERAPVRRRRTKAQMAALRRQIVEVLTHDHPQSVRHVFYRMTDPRLEEPVEKTDKGYTVVQRLCVKLRREGTVPYGWITDATRRGYFAITFSGPAEALERTAALYRRSYWDTAPCHVEVWCESRSIAGVIQHECLQLGVPLYPAGGFASVSFSWDGAQNIADDARGRPVHILYIGDYDPAGVLIDRKIEEEYRRHLPGHSIRFHRLAINPDQIALMGLPTKPPKAGKKVDKRGGFTGGTVEAEAMPAHVMCEILRKAVEAFIDRAALRTLEAAEESERAQLRLLASAVAYEARP